MSSDDTHSDTRNNAEQIRYWNDAAGNTWVEAQARLDAMLAPISAAMLERARPRTGEHALDVGCGCGDTTLTLGEQGVQALGVDISAPMLERARQRAAALADKVAFMEADAAAHPFEATFDLIVSRFGVMFFADPHAAFANLRGALKPQGRLVFMCWQAPQENPWISIAGAAVQPFLAPPQTPPDPRAPGPFAFADPDYVRDILASAGFVDVAVEPHLPTLQMAGSLDEAMHFQTQIGPLARVMAELEGEQREAALAAARAALAPHVTAAGLALDGACWMVTARV